MRVVAGRLGGRRLQAPAGQGTRPTSDRVRAAACNSLEAHGLLAGAEVLDLFAGSGAMGIEALSRGAAFATFVEPDRQALAVVSRNLAALGLTGDSEVHAMTADSFINAVPMPGTRTHWDLAILDPPYAFGAWEVLLDALPADRALCESDRPVPLPEGWMLERHKRHGGTWVTIARRAPSSGGPHTPDAGVPRPETPDTARP